jgi:predicted nuclease of predicted toxin-antitoxin system
VASVKLDENVPDSVAAILRAGGHDVAFARDQQLAGASDEQLLSVAAHEARVLVSLDRDFTNILRHPPDLAAGIVVFRLQKQTLAIINHLAAALALQLNQQSPAQRLWIFDESRLRIWPRETA